MWSTKRHWNKRLVYILIYWLDKMTFIWKTIRSLHDFAKRIFSMPTIFFFFWNLFYETIQYWKEYFWRLIFHSVWNSFVFLIFVNGFFFWLAPPAWDWLQPRFSTYLLPWKQCELNYNSIYSQSIIYMKMLISAIK